MKKIKILFLSAVMLMVSCNDFLSLQPANLIVPQTLNDVKKMVGNYLYSMQNGKIQSYTLYRCNGYANNENFFKFEDDVSFEGLFFLFYDSYDEREKRWINNDWENLMWRALYMDVGDFNLYIYELEQLKDNSVEAKQVEAEVRFCRAISYFRLLQFYCPYRANEFAGDPERYGLPILKKEEDLGANFYPKRLSQQETYQFIIDDLQRIIEFNVIDGDWNLFYNIRAVYGLLAELYMWKAESPAKEDGDWAKARDYAVQSIGTAKMASGAEEITNLFNPLRDNNSPALTVNVLPDYGGLYEEIFNSSYHNIVVEDEVFNLYTENDYRRDIYINPETKLIVKYYQADEANYNTSLFWRVEEMYLLIAESYFRTGDNNKAKEYLDNFKKTRMPTVNNYSDILKEIQLERRKEFFAEPYARWRDMKRYGVPLLRTSRKDGSELRLDANDYKYSFVIPVAGELQQNPNNFQNPGWTTK